MSITDFCVNLARAIFSQFWTSTFVFLSNENRLDNREPAIGSDLWRLTRNSFGFKLALGFCPFHSFEPMVNSKTFSPSIQCSTLFPKTTIFPCRKSPLGSRVNGEDSLKLGTILWRETRQIKRLSCDYLLSHLPRTRRLGLVFQANPSFSVGLF